MSIYYNGDHSITFWNVGEQYTTGNPFNTWDDFHLIPLSRPYVVEPEANAHIIPIAGTNKRIDITDRLPGGLTFGKRSGQWEFVIDHGQYSNWASSYRSILNFFHGKKMMVSLNDDPAKIYYGVITVTGYNPGSDYTTVTLQYDLDKGYYDFSDVEAPVIPSQRFPTDIDLLQRVRFYGLNNSLLDESYYRIGDFPNIPSIPDEDNYDFKHWNPSIQLVNGSIDYHAVYEYISDSSSGGGGGGGGDTDVKVKYRFLYNGTVITEGEIEKNQTPPEPSPSQLPIVEGYFFDSWNPIIGKINEDTDYEAVYLPYPVEIKIAVQPTKTNYEDGETIDYSGMVVKAYTVDGDLWTDGTHPDGIIPLSELTLDYTAEYNEQSHSDAEAIVDQNNTSIIKAIRDVGVFKIGYVNDASVYLYASYVTNQYQHHEYIDRYEFNTQDSPVYAVTLHTLYNGEPKDWYMDFYSPEQFVMTWHRVRESKTPYDNDIDQTGTYTGSKKVFSGRTFYGVNGWQFHSSNNANERRVKPGENEIDNSFDSVGNRYAQLGYVILFSDITVAKPVRYDIGNGTILETSVSIMITRAT